jgi:hypothetical protein
VIPHLYQTFTSHLLILARITLRLGQMPSIDLAFADAPWPSPGPDHIPTTDFGVIPCFRYHLEMTKLADLLGRACELSLSKLRVWIDREFESTGGQS